MENIKFYEVKIGTMTRAGNLNVITSFVAKSDKEQNKVYNFYIQKYKGLSIQVSEIIEVVEDVIPNEVNYSFIAPKDQEIRDLKKQVDILSKQSFNSFIGRIRWDIVVNTEFKELIEISKLYREKKEEIDKRLEVYIKEKYNTISVDYVSIGEYKLNDTYIPFTVKIDGSIKPSDNEIL